MLLFYISEPRLEEDGPKGEEKKKKRNHTQHSHESKRTDLTLIKKKDSLWFLPSNDGSQQGEGEQRKRLSFIQSGKQRGHRCCGRQERCRRTEKRRWAAALLAGRSELHGAIYRIAIVSVPCVWGSNKLLHGDLLLIVPKVACLNTMGVLHHLQAWVWMCSCINLVIRSDLLYSYTGSKKIMKKKNKDYIWLWKKKKVLFVSNWCSQLVTVQGVPSPHGFLGLTPKSLHYRSRRWMK